jgi:hypothetical protein
MIRHIPGPIAVHRHDDMKPDDCHHHMLATPFIAGMMAVARGLPAVLITLSGGLEVGFSQAEGEKCLEETKGHPLLL